MLQKKNFCNSCTRIKISPPTRHVQQDLLKFLRKDPITRHLQLSKQDFIQDSCRKAIALILTQESAKCFTPHAEQYSRLFHPGAVAY